MQSVRTQISITALQAMQHSRANQNSTTQINNATVQMRIATVMWHCKRDLQGTATMLERFARHCHIVALPCCKSLLERSPWLHSLSPVVDLCNLCNLCNLMREVSEITLDFATILFIAVKPCSMERGAAQVVDRRRRSQAATIFSHFQEKKSPPLESECWKYIISV